MRGAGDGRGLPYHAVQPGGGVLLFADAMVRILIIGNNALNSCGVEF